MSVPPRLSQLLALAEQGPTLRAALAEEVAELLAAWPKDHPAEMRGACEALLARAMRDASPAARARLQARRDATRDAARPPAPERALIAAAREGTGTAAKLARVLGIATPVAEEILRDASGRSLAVAAKSVNLSRSDFSALALLCHPKPDRKTTYALLDAYDGVAAPDAAQTLRGSRARQAEAAE